MLVAINLTRHLVLLMINLRLLLRRQLAAIGRAIPARFAVDAGFVPLDMPRLSRRQLPALHALRNARLLVFLAVFDLSRLR